MSKQVSSFSIVIFFILFIIIGSLSISLLSIQLSPTKTTPNLTISFSWYNASSRTIESEVTCIIESMLGTIEGITEINSKSSDGVGQINIKLKPNTDIQILRYEVSSLIRQIYPKLPKQVSYPQISFNNPDDIRNLPFLIYTITEIDHTMNIRKYTTDFIIPKLATIDGISKIQISGANEQQWQVAYNHDDLLKYNISIQEIMESIRKYFSNQSLGVAYTKNIINDTLVNSIIIKHIEYDTLHWNIPLKIINNKIVYLTDICKITKSMSNVNSYFRINGMNTINLLIYPSDGVNTLNLRNSIQRKIDDITFESKTYITIINNYDSTTYISNELNKILQTTSYTFLITLLFIFFVKFSFRFLLIVCSGIFSSIMIAFIFYYLFRIDIHLFSLAGYSLSIGMILDNIIIMTNHYIHKKDLTVYPAIIASSATTLASLSVVFFLDDIQKFNLLDFASIIVVNISVSLFVSLFFIPALLDIFPYKTIQIIKHKKYQKSQRKRWILRISKIYFLFLSFLVARKKLVVIIVILFFGIPTFLLPTDIKGDKWYCKLYNNTLGSEFYYDNLKPHIDKYLGGSLRLFVENFMDRTHNSSSTERPAVNLYITMPMGSQIIHTNDFLLKIEKFLSQFSEIEQYHTNIFTNREARLTIYFKKRYEYSPIVALIEQEIKKIMSNISGISWNLSGITLGGSGVSLIQNSGQYRIKLIGYNFDDVVVIATKLKSKLLSNPRIMDIDIKSDDSYYKEDEYKYILKTNSYLLSQNNLRFFDYYNHFHFYNLADIPYVQVFLNTNYEKIDFVNINSSKTDIWKIFNEHLYPTISSHKVLDISTITKEALDANICKENQQYRIVLSYNYNGADDLGDEYMVSMIEDIKKELPLGYKADKMKYDWSPRNKSQYYVILLVLLSIFFICSILLESFIQALAVMSLIPFSCIGVFLTFYYFDLNYDLGLYTSFIILSGISVNYSLYIVNDFNVLKKKLPSVKLNQIYKKAHQTKFTSILISILSTSFSLFPFLLDSTSNTFWFTLAAGTIGGIIFSIFGIAFVLPLFFVRKKCKSKLSC